MPGKQGPNSLFSMPSKTKCILLVLVSEMGGPVRS
jgi:hypothetical protein